MPKRSLAIQKLVDSVNAILASQEVVILRDGKLQTVSSKSNEGQAFKDGLCECLQIALNASESYNGYMYLELDENSNILDKFKRKYF